MSRTNSIILKVVDSLGNVSYLQIGTDSVQLTSASGIPLSLSNIVQDDAFMLAHELSKAQTAAEAILVAEKHVYKSHKITTLVDAAASEVAEADGPMEAQDALNALINNMERVPAEEGDDPACQTFVFRTDSEQIIVVAEAGQHGVDWNVLSIDRA